MMNLPAHYSVFMYTEIQERGSRGAAGRSHTPRTVSLCIRGRCARGGARGRRAPPGLASLKQLGYAYCVRDQCERVFVPII